MRNIIQFLGIITISFLIGVNSQNQTNYVPIDQIFLNCGGPNSTDSDGRVWISDATFSPSTTTTSTSAATQKPDVPQVPYMTARVSRSNFTYTIPASPGRVFLRLHFYSAAYGNLTAADALFFATSGAYTLLKNFSAAQTMEALELTHMVKEFSINIPAGENSLTVTFAPASATNSYAFVNGIELVSHPDTFATASALAVGQSGGFQIDNATALENVRRLNVGGNAIKPSDDNGLFRSWGADDDYLFGAAHGLVRGLDPNVTVAVPGNYAAPLVLYTTLRSVGPNMPVNRNSNLTWYFKIDSGFSYLVRLHFCEISANIFKTNQIIFTIFLNNQTASEVADVIAWAGGNGVPIHRDFVVFVATGPPQQNLWLDLHPYTASNPQFYDAILNGLEIFKINDSRGNLGGPNPTRTQSESDAPSSNKPPSKNHSAAIGGGVGAGVAALLVVVLVVILVARRRRKGAASEEEGWLALSKYGNSPSLFSRTTTTTATSIGSSLPSGLCRHFSFAEIKAATNNFDEALLLGLGGFGKVYSGVIEITDGTTTKVAIKRGNPLSQQGVHEFQTEIEMLSKLRHRHLVSLIGFCQEKHEMILVYDYMSNGTLREHLYNAPSPATPALSWKQRLGICIGAARGLHYLHTGVKHTIIHRDVKTTNILLDEKWVAKVSDFGLSKTGPSLDDTHVSTLVKGSFGYLDPEYYRRQQLTEKSDVYSFGVVLFEVLCGRPPLMRKLPKEQVSLAEWARRCYEEGRLGEITDPCLVGKIAAESFEKFAETAAKCVDEVGVERPSMGDVLWNLEFALQLQESAEEGLVVVADDLDLSRSVASLDSSGVTPSAASLDSSGVTPTAVFSQIMNADGR
ncbi:receptor-like protein kinase FERONIA [Salvia hispanica]|uniref:receptor-like protein kinase FERONIA n=1 Tax=Salvia hispanica TaxID=49212 RepID=UPI0020098810|nr:receptor-like protein kinase FERONIA [Salvia hispanica]